jgi:class I fructose-bisphosphate aldolase
MYEEIRSLIEEARSVGLPSIIWSYPRGSGISKQGETAIDVIAYGAHIACQLGAHIVKVKPPTDYIEQAEARTLYEQHKVPLGTLTDRIRHVVDCCFGGRRIVIFSGGAAKGDSDVLFEVGELARGGAFGSIMGRNLFQRTKTEAITLLDQVIEKFRAVSP